MNIGNQVTQFCKIFIAGYALLNTTHLRGIR